MSAPDSHDQFPVGGGRARRVADALIFVHGFTDCSEEKLLANLIEQSEPLQFVLYRVFEFGKRQFDPGFPECFIQF